MKIVDITGKKFGRLTVIKKVGSKNHSSVWLCKCDCGCEKEITLNHLRQGTKSCGCLSIDISSERGKKSKIGERSRKHGDFGTKLYGIWAGMKRRCQNPNTKYYADYGGRGIKVCEEWQEYIPFKEWAILNGYHEGLSIERKDVNGDYCSENCIWIPLSEQNRNKRVTIHLNYNGKDYTIKEIAEITGLKERTIKGRYERGWDVEKIFTKKMFNNQYEKGT
ncbi:MAG: AP2 domain-containing protein [Lachnospiraceae bacterium]